MKNIQFVDLKRQYDAYKDYIDLQIKEVIESTSFIMGPKIKELEDILGSYVGVKHAISCSSGTDALLLALMAYAIAPGDEIITTPFTFIATAEVISLLGAKPVFVDIDETSFNINPHLIKNAITDKTKGIIAVDLFGQPADYHEINKVAEENKLFVIEDAAQSFGATYHGKRACSLSEITCTSFFPAKPFGCYGDGGMVFTNNDQLADLCESIRVHGKGNHKYDNIRIGINARMDTIQAAVLLGKFPHFNMEIDKRNLIADIYQNELGSHVLKPKILDHNVSAWAQYCIRSQRRDELQAFLNKKGIPTAIYYPKPLHLQEAFSDLGYKAGDFPVCENIARDILALPMHPFLTNHEIDTIVESVNQFT